MFKLYGVEYTYQVDAAGINLQTGTQEFRVGLQYLPLITQLQAGVPEAAVLDKMSLLFWELYRTQPPAHFKVYQRRQLSEVPIYLPPDAKSELIDACISTYELNIVDDPAKASYVVELPTEIDGTFLSVDKTTIVITFGFHGTRVSPLLFPPLGSVTYRSRLAWAEGFCFQNFDYVAPKKLELHFAAFQLRKQVVDFALERAGYLFYPEVGSFLRAELPGDVE